MTIWDNHFSALGILGYYMIGETSTMVKSIDYDSRYGHCKTESSRYIEDINNIDDFDSATEFKGYPVVK
jgi:hypothetical protein